MPLRRFFKKGRTLIDDLLFPGTPITSACTQHGGAVKVFHLSKYNDQVLAVRLTPWPCRKQSDFRQLVSDCAKWLQPGEWLQPAADVRLGAKSVDWSLGSLVVCSQGGLRRSLTRHEKKLLRASWNKWVASYFSPAAVELRRRQAVPSPRPPSRHAASGGAQLRQRSTAGEVAEGTAAGPELRDAESGSDADEDGSAAAQMQAAAGGTPCMRGQAEASRGGRRAKRSRGSPQLDPLACQGTAGGLAAGAAAGAAVGEDDSAAQCQTAGPARLEDNGAGGLQGSAGAQPCGQSGYRSRGSAQAADGVPECAAARRNGSRRGGSNLQQAAASYQGVAQRPGARAARSETPAAPVVDAVPRRKRARSAACQPAAEDMAMPRDLASVQAAAVTVHRHLEACLAAAQECDKQQLAALVAAHRRVVDDIDAQAVETRRQAAASGAQERWGSCCASVSDVEGVLDAAQAAEAEAAGAAFRATMAAMASRTAGPRPQYVPPASVEDVEASYAALQNRRRSPRGSKHQADFSAELAELAAGSAARPASDFPAIVEAPALLPTAEQEAAVPPMYLHPFQEIRPGQTVVPRGGGDPLLQVRQVPAGDADALTAWLVDALDGRRLPLLPAELGKHSLEAWGGIRWARNDGSCGLYMQYDTDEGAAQHEFAKALMLQYHKLLCKHFPAEMLAEHQALPLIAYACVRHEGITVPCTHFAVTRDHVSTSHVHSHERMGCLFMGMAGDGEAPDGYVFVIPGLRVWMRIVPGLLLRFDSSRFTHATWYKFDPQPPTAEQSAGKQHTYGVAMVQKGNVMAAMEEVVRSILVPGLECTNMCLRGERVFKDLVAGDPINGRKSGAELLAEMRVCD